MSTRPPQHDPLDIWQSQEGNHITMSLHDFQERLRKLRIKSRRDGVKTLVIGAVSLVILISIFLRTDELLQRFAWGLMILGVGIAMVPHVIGLWKGAQMGNPAPGMAMTTGIQAYRQLLRPRRSEETWGALTLLLTLFGLMLILLPMVAGLLNDPNREAPFVRILPFSLILVAWGVSFVIGRRRRQAWLRRELELLSNLEKENP